MHSDPVHASSRIQRRALSGVPLRELWGRPLSHASAQESGSRNTPDFRLQAIIPSSATFRRHVQNSHQWKITKILGDPMTVTPPNAPHVFYSCGLLESIFLCVNAGTFSPLIFEMFMPYHLKYTGLIAAWWGGTYIGLNVAQYGPLEQSVWITARGVVGVSLFSAGVTALILADGVGNWGPWPSYWLLATSYSSMAAFDLALFQRQLLPPWLLKWKITLSGIIVASLLLGVLKGKYLENNAQRLIFEEALALDQ